MAWPGFYIVRKDSWYAERVTWGIAGSFLLVATVLGWLVHPVFALGITATGLFSWLTAATGYCVVSTVLVNLGVGTRLEVAPTVLRGYRVYRMRTDSWFLERGIYAVVGTTQTLGSLLAIFYSPWWFVFTGFVGAMSIAFAYSGFCPVANALYFLGFEPRLSPRGQVTTEQAPLAEGHATAA